MCKLFFVRSLAAYDRSDRSNRAPTEAPFAVCQRGPCSWRPHRVEYNKRGPEVAPHRICRPPEFGRPGRGAAGAAV